ncbi:hybrid sensor histidine kinase/response regulator [Thiohalomonas denitrificans]|uniref:hybrid sensor histidine kinase/response regulator n=1 Tax=Thiohalomonas denitrificans TaxID=415747 RepID=UPI0026EAC819|nr:Hpt domain-containing protein [Thiohalomonas denitrificans]
MQTAETFDVSTLAWIKGELDETLEDARQALESFAEAPEDVGQLDPCIDALHQVHRTLQMVELSAAAQFLAEVEIFARALQRGELTPADGERGEAEEALMRAILELPDYLDALQSGRPDSLLPLLPLVNEMRRLRGEAEWSQLSVFHPDLSIRPPSRESAGNLQAVARKARPHYQTALANLLRDREAASSLQTLQKVLDALFKIADESSIRQALWAASALVEALSEKGLEPSIEVKHLLGKIEQLVKYLAQKEETAANAEHVQALTRVLLYHVGRATAGGVLVAGIKDAFGLDRFFLEEGSAGLTAELKRTVAADIMEELSHVKDQLDVFVRGQRGDLESLQPIGDGLHRLVDTLDLLRQVPLQQALKEQVGVLGRIRLGELEPEDEVLMGVAGALLLVESTLQDWGSSAPMEKADDSGERAGESPEAEHLRGVRQVMKESLSDLIRIRESLSAYLDNPGDVERLSSLPADFHRLVASLDLLSYSRVARILQASAAYVRGEILNGNMVPDTSRLDQLADAVMSVEYYLEAFVQSRVHPASVLDVAENALAGLGFPVGDLLEGMDAGEPWNSKAGESTPSVAGKESVEGTGTAAGAEANTGGSITDAAEHGDEIDDEIAAVFLEEAQEELERITRLLPVWEANPSDHSVLAEYRRSFHTLKGSGRLVGAHELGEFAWSFEKMLNRVIDRGVEPDPLLFEVLHRAERVIPQLVEQFRTGTRPDIEVKALADAADALTRGDRPVLPEEGTPVEPAESPKPAIDTDPELLDIYAKETAEHLAAIDRFLFECRSEGVRYASEPLVRALHTLKGSSQIAGVAEAARIAEALEKYSKALQTVHQPLSNDWIAVLQESRDLVEGVLVHLNNPSIPLPPGGDLQTRAEAFYASVRHLEKRVSPDDTFFAEPGEAENPPTSMFSGGQTAPELNDLHGPDDCPLPGSDSLQAVDVPTAPRGWTETADCEGEEASELVRLFLEEGGEILDESERLLEAWTAQPDDRKAVQGLQHQLHTLKGSARLAGIVAVGDLSHQLESVYEAIIEGRLSPTPALLSELQLDHDRLVSMLEQVRHGEQVEGDANDIARLKAAAQGVTSALSGEQAPEPGSRAAAETGNEDEEDPELLELFLEEGREILDSSEQILQSWLETPNDHSLVQSLQRQLHTLKGSARMAGVAAIGDLSHALESTFEALLERRAQVLPELLEAIQQAHDRLSTMLEQVWEHQPVPAAEELTRRIMELLRTPEAPSEPEAALPDPSLGEPAAYHRSATAESTERLQAAAHDFYPEAMRLVEHFGAELQHWQGAPSDIELHAALTGTGVSLEQLAREADVQNMVDLVMVTGMLLSEVRDGHVPVSDDLFGLMHLVHERLSLLVEQHYHGLPLGGVQDLIDSIKELIARHLEKRGEKEDAEDNRQSTRIQHEMVRVRRDLMDNLVNYAGEVSIYRSRIEQRLNSFGFSIGELDETVDRLRHQLRQFDIETEAQISARYQDASEEYDDFDPLEFDRFTNMQQLSRAMMESLSDIGSIKGMMTEIERESETLLLQQARVNTELQENLMQTRMVPLVDNAPRLRRIVRQTASEIGRKASLGFQGAEVEMDRRVVERLIAPLEHMLRNAVAHGIESPEERLAAGKSETGSITIALSREGAEVVVRVSDDGRGIDADAVRDKAIERGLMEADANLGEQEVMQFIFESGFSTAAALSQVAGRGIGMDVVSSEVRQLSGSMDIDSVKGQGTRFTVRLPFSLSVSRALIVHVGEQTFAIPLLSVQGIARADPAEVEELLQQEHPTYSWLGESYELMHPRQAIGIDEVAAPSEVKKQPLLLAQSGEHRIALIVDRIEGSREVVIKSLGPQLSMLQSLSGATILADGSIALVLELSALIRRGIAHRHRVGKQLASGATPAPSVPTVMIVDDSITVRAVTKRLLKRHGMNAVAAKDGVDALTILEEITPDVMLLDIEMPRMDGFELATHIRNSEALKDIPIIMITSRTGEKHRQRATDIGVNRYMGKPYSEGDLMENIESLIGDAESWKPAG